MACRDAIRTVCYLKFSECFIDFRHCEVAGLHTAQTPIYHTAIFDYMASDPDDMLILFF